MIVVIDYNIGNVKSVCNAFEHIGCEAKLSREPNVIRDAAGIVLPGVAAFGYAMEALGELAGLIKELTSRGKSLLGICVGYQMLFDKSSEYGNHRGLGLVKGEVVPLPAEQRVPHMGWNHVELPADMKLFVGLGQAKHFYFAHSYYASVTDGTVKTAYTDYGFGMVASIQKENIYGVQFHPEKSGPNGLRILQNFYDLCRQ